MIKLNVYNLNNAFDYAFVECQYIQERTNKTIFVAKSFASKVLAKEYAEEVRETSGQNIAILEWNNAD